MGEWRDRWRILFGKTPVSIKGTFSYDETIDRLDLVLSRRFLSKHFRRTLAGGPNDQGHLQFVCGYNFYFMRHVIERTKAKGRFPVRPEITQQLIGDLEIDKGNYVWFRGYLQTPKIARIALFLLLLTMVGNAFLLPLVFGLGLVPFLTVLFIGIFFPAWLIFYSAAAYGEAGEKLSEMLKLAMTQQLE